MTRGQWISLEQKIYFGHRSVGNGIITGIREIMGKMGPCRLEISSAGNSVNLKPGMLIHSEIGRNGDAVSKIDSFREIINRGLGNQVDIALFKLCYVDITAGSDIRRIFDYYRRTMDELQRKFPKVKFAHVTVPLRTVQTGWKAAVKKALYLPVRGYGDNMARNEYNEMLRREYGSGGRLFDLAGIESTYQNGGRSQFTGLNGIYYCLAPVYTDDGGHLNRTGRKAVAEKFLIFLADLD